jgi:hypothetical protein
LTSFVGRLWLIALIDQAPLIQQILRHLDLPAEVPAPPLARAPPFLEDDVIGVDAHG